MFVKCAIRQVEVDVFHFFGIFFFFVEASILDSGGRSLAANIRAKGGEIEVFFAVGSGVCVFGSGCPFDFVYLEHMFKVLFRFCIIK